MRKLVIFAVALSGCTSNEPTWALDVMFVSPEGAGITGSQTWQVYRNAWQRGFKERHYLCSVLVTFDGTASIADCPECLGAMDVAPEVADSDCDDALTSNPTFVSLLRLGFGPIGTGGPYPDQSSVGYADYGPGWEVHGWAYPDSLAQGEAPESTTWDGTEPFAMAPTYAWQLSADPSTAAVSRLAIEGATDEGQ